MVQNFVFFKIGRTYLVSGFHVKLCAFVPLWQKK